MRQKRVLTIIDLQIDFLDAIKEREAEDVISYVTNLLQTKKYDLIINLTYGDLIGDTVDERISKLLSKLPNVVYLCKFQNDGSQEVFNALYAKDIDHNACKLEIVGVNTDWCVADTIQGLYSNRMYANVHLHSKGVATINGADRNEHHVTLLKHLYNINVIKGE